MFNKFFILHIFLYMNLYSSGLKIEQAINFLRDNNREIAIANSEIESQKFKLDSISGYKYGKLDLTQRAMRTNDAGENFGFKLTSREANFNDFGFDEFLAKQGSIQTDGGTSLLQTQPKHLNYPEATNFFQTELKYELPIYTGGKLFAGEQIANKMIEMSKLSRDKLIDEKIYELRKSYSDMALLNATYLNLENINNNLKTLENIAKNMKSEGYGKEVDLLEVKARRSAVERMINQIEARRELLYKYISFLIGQNVKNIEISCSDQDFKIPTVEIFLANNLDLQKGKHGLAIYDNLIDIAKSEFLPKIGAFGKVSTADNNFLNEADRHFGWTIGIQLSLNLFNGGVDKANLEESKVEKLKNENKIRLAETGLKLQFETIVTEIKNLNDEIARLNSELELVNQIYKNYEEYYRENLNSMSDVIIKQSEQLQKIMELLQLRNKRNERIFALRNLYHNDIN